MTTGMRIEPLAAPDKPAEADLNDQILRQILCSVDGNAQLSQRQLSRELGIALGSVNWYLKRCMHKGLIKISQVPLKRYMYYLTPQGLEEKSRLTAQYLKWSLDFFRLGREEASAILAGCARRDHHHIILAGNSDFAEIFIMSAMDYPVTIASIFDPTVKDGKRLRTPINANVSMDAGMIYILTEIAQPQRVWDHLRAHDVAAEAIIIPRLLNFRPQQGEGASCG